MQSLKQLDNLLCAGGLHQTKKVCRSDKNIKTKFHFYITWKNNLFRVVNAISEYQKKY